MLLLMARTVAHTTDRRLAERVQERIERRYDELAPAERRVAEQLLQLGPDELLLSAVALGERLATSDATIVRTAKALGYASLGELRRALAAESVAASPDTRLGRTLRHADRDDLLASFAAQQIAGVEGLLRNVDRDSFNRSADLLTAADRVVWRGVGPSAELARYGELLSTRVGKPSTSFVNSGTSFADELLTLRRGDAVVLLAYGALQSHVNVLLDRARRLGTPVVLVTDTLGRKLATRVEVTLRSGRGTPGEFASHATTLVLVEALTLAIASRTRTTATTTLQTLNELRAAIARRRLDVDTPA
jgi:DNA-binding MurR/RpiR family transcriptional regulator